MMKSDPNWAGQKEEVMMQVAYSKVKQVSAFKKELLETGERKLAETVPGEVYWASGMDEEMTRVTKRSYWLGENRMGQLLE